MKNLPMANVRGGFGHYFDVERPGGGGARSVWGRFFSAGLYADSIDSSACPPEGGRYVGQNPDLSYAIFRARLKLPRSLVIFSCNCRIAYSRASGRGGHPGTKIS